MTGRETADLPLHTGSTPPWLFRRMVEMAGAITTLIVRDQRNPATVIGKRLRKPLEDDLGSVEISKRIIDRHRPPKNRNVGFAVAASI